MGFATCTQISPENGCSVGEKQRRLATVGKSLPINLGFMKLIKSRKPPSSYHLNDHWKRIERELSPLDNNIK